MEEDIPHTCYTIVSVLDEKPDAHQPPQLYTSLHLFAHISKYLSRKRLSSILDMRIQTDIIYLSEDKVCIGVIFTVMHRDRSSPRVLDE